MIINPYRKPDNFSLYYLVKTLFRSSTYCNDITDLNLMMTERENRTFLSKVDYIISDLEGMEIGDTLKDVLYRILDTISDNGNRSYLVTFLNADYHVTTGEYYLMYGDIHSIKVDLILNRKNKNKETLKIDKIYVSKTTNLINEITLQERIELYHSLNKIRDNFTLTGETEGIGN